MKFTSKFNDTTYRQLKQKETITQNLSEVCHKIFNIPFTCIVNKDRSFPMDIYRQVLTAYAANTYTMNLTVLGDIFDRDPTGICQRLKRFNGLSKNDPNDTRYSRKTRVALYNTLSTTRG